MTEGGKGDKKEKQERDRRGRQLRLLLNVRAEQREAACHVNANLSAR